MEKIKSIIQDLIKQVGVLWKFLLIYVYLPSFAVLLLVLLFLKANPTLAPEYLFRDIATLGELPFYAGAVSQLGSLLWGATVTSCLLSLALLKRMGIGSQENRKFLLQSALLSVFLLMDDMFLIHEEVAKTYLHISQKKVYFAYFFIILTYLYANQKAILSSKYFILLLSMATLGFSMAMDLIADNIFKGVEGSFFYTWEVYFEDGIKFIGIVTWLAFHLYYIKDIFAPSSDHNTIG